MLPPYLTDAEIAEICRPRKQGAAQIRYLRSLGIRAERRADGTPLVWRADLAGADGPSVYGEMGAAPTIARARSMWNGRAEYLKTPNVGGEAHAPRTEA